MIELAAWWVGVCAMLGISAATLQEHEEHMAPLWFRALCYSVYLAAIPIWMPLLLLIGLIARGLAPPEEER